MTAQGKHVEVVGVPKVTGAFDGLAKDTKDVTTPSAELGRMGRDESLRVVPRLTGALAAAIVERHDAHGVELVVDEDHAGYMEFGTRYVMAHRYMKAGFDAMSQAAPDVYGRWLDHQVKDAGG